MEPQPAEGGFFCTGYAGASADGKHAIFAANAKIGPEAPEGKGFSLYEWSAAKGLKLASILPNGKAAPPFEASAVNPGTGFGAAGGNCKMDQGIVRHAISTDGSVVFWTFGGKYEGNSQPLMARVGGTKTIEIDAKVGGGKGGEGRFWAASGDGSKAFFTSPNKLIAGPTTTVGDFYRYDFAKPEGNRLTNLTPGMIAPEIEGVIGASEDGNYAYFVATSSLSGEEENAAGEKATTGKNNLYLYHEGEGVRFVAILGDESSADWASAPEKLTARLTPDGRHLAFLTNESEALSGFTNTIAPPAPPHCQSGAIENHLNGGSRCPEAYLYDADTKTLTCVSCNPAGSRPLGPAAFPVWSNPYEGPRYLSDDGSRLYFESRDVLSSADRNEKRDVYEFERDGAGDCDGESADFNPAVTACISLVSDGNSTDESYLLDASSTGRDVFFATRGRLVGWDENENYDVYDAREDGGLPEPAEPASVCENEACKPPPVSQPSAGSPATNTFVEPGNRKPKKAKHHGKKHHKTKRHHKRRAGR
jgi:hypothetical protein